MIFLLLRYFWEKRVEADRRGQHLRRRVRNRLALEEAVAGKHLSQHRAEGTDVRALVWVTIYLTDYAERRIIITWKRQRPYKKRYFTSLISRTAKPSCFACAGQMAL